MAIQFHCPSCAALLKVSDAAAGKKGSCPKCGAALLVPRVQAPRETAGVVEPRETAPIQSSAADVSRETAPPVRDVGLPSNEAAGSDDPLSFLAHVEPTLPVAVSRGSPTLGRLRRRRTGVWGIVVPLLFFAAFAGVGGWVYFREAVPRLEGTLRAEALVDEQPPPGFITHMDADLPEDVFSELLKELQARPLPPIRSNLMELEFEAGRKALEVHLRATPATQFFRVDVNRDPVLRRYRTDRAKELGQPRREEFTAAATKMLDDWRESGSIDPARYRDAAGLNALLTALGYHLQAVVDGRVYRAVAEDADGRVYFLLPPGTRQFRIEGRELKDGRVLFPGRYTVRVVRQANESPRDVETETPESPDETSTVREPEAEGIEPVP